MGEKNIKNLAESAFCVIIARFRPVFAPNRYYCCDSSSSRILRSFSSVAVSFALQNLSSSSARTVYSLRLSMLQFSLCISATIRCNSSIAAW